MEDQLSQSDKSNLEPDKKSMPEPKENPFLNLIVNVVAPFLILTKLSKPEMLGQFWALIIALSLPILYGAYDFATRKKTNFFSIIGFISVLLTGVIGLFELDKTWMIVKETAIPLIFGIVTFVSTHKPWAIIPKFLEQALDLTKIQEAFTEKSDTTEYNKMMVFASYSLSGSFLLSAVLNYGLAVWILKGEPGSVEFNESLGEMTALSFPVIVAPMMIVMGFIFYRILKILKEKAGLEIEDVIKK